MLLAVFCFLYVLIDVTGKLDEIIERKIPFTILAKYYLTSLPIFFTQMQAVPVACLLAPLLTFSQLNNHNEIIAMRSSGLNFWQITKPAISFSILIVIALFWFNESYVPQATVAVKQIRDENMILKVDRERKKKEKIRNLTFYGLKNRLYFIDAFDANNDELSGITILEYDAHQNVKQKLVAFRGKWTGIAWKFYQCQITEFSPESVNLPVKVKVYKEKLMDIKETPEDFLRQRLNVSSMNFQQLKAYINRFANSGATQALRNLKVDMHQKLTFPLGSFVTVLCGLPFVLMVKSRKRSAFTSVAIAFAIGLLYFVTNAVALAFGKGGLFPPIISTWCAPVIFTAIAISTIENNF